MSLFSHALRSGLMLNPQACFYLLSVAIKRAKILKAECIQWHNPFKGLEKL